MNETKEEFPITDIAIVGDTWDTLTDAMWKTAHQSEKLVKNTNDISYHLNQINDTLLGILEVLNKKGE